ncbi:DUF262 domain-containing protein [Carnobacterium sp.]
MGFEARGDSIKGLLTSTRQYKIPRFQRDFSWDQSNYNEFYEDIVNNISFQKEKFVNNQYYFGNMLFLGEKEDSEVEVIDGQQRLTTITIFLAALRDTLYSIENDQIAQDYADTIHLEYLIKKIDGKPQRKLETMSSFPYFTQTIQDSEKPVFEVEPKTEEEESLKKTFDFFKKQISKQVFLKKMSLICNVELAEKHYVEALKAVREQLLNSEIINIFVTERNQVNKIFENINSKGKPLTQVDLIKNAIFGVVPLSSAGVDEMSLKWDEFGEKLTKLDTNFNEFFLHNWKATYPKDNANGATLYKKYLKRFDSKDSQEITDFVNELSLGLDIYEYLIAVDPSNFKQQEKKAELEFLDALNKFGAVQVRVPLLTLYKSKIKIQNSKRIDFLKFLSYFHFVVYGTSIKFRGNNTTTPFKNFSVQVINAKNASDIYSGMDKLKLDLMGLLNKDEVDRAFKELSFSKEKARSGLSEYPTQFVIKQIANHLEGRNYSPVEYTIEHIIDEEIGNSNSIGNLIVLERKLNDKINKKKQKIEKEQKHGKNEITFEEKTVIYEESAYKMVKDLVASYPEFNFNHDAIKLRTEELSTQFWIILESLVK